MMKRIEILDEDKPFTPFVLSVEEEENSRLTSERMDRVSGKL